MRNYFLCAAALLALTGCNENDHGEKTSGGYISLDATAARETRAAIATVSTLEGDAAGFKVWGVAADKPDEWYDGGEGELIDGSNNHVFGQGQTWDFVTRVKWPSATTSYPMNFYACYPAAATGLSMNSQTPDALSGTYTVPSTAAEQIDLLGAHAVTGALKPSNDILNITFKHLLSKVNYGFHVESEYDVWVQSLTVENVANERVYDFISESWTPASAPAAENCTESYLYLGAVKQFSGNDTATPVYAATDNANLMLMPQNVTAQNWVPDSDLPGDKAYVRVVYRIQRGGEDYIGYGSAASHPDYAASQAEAGNYEGSLFIVAGYPFTLDWEAGKGYTYNIVLPGTSGGVLLEPVYYDETGQPTDLSVKNLVPGNPLLGDGYIHLVPEVEDWADQWANDLL